MQNKLSATGGNVDLDNAVESLQAYNISLVGNSRQDTGYIWLLYAYTHANKMDTLRRQMHCNTVF